jgi:hypothetical protein
MCMSKITKSTSRESKQRKSKNGMRVSNRSIFTIQAVQIKKGSK